MKHLYNSLFLFSALIFFACNGRAQKKLAIIGSSTSACFNVGNIDSCYVTRLQKYYNNSGMPVTINNLSRAGDDCYRGMPDGYTPPPGRNAPASDRNITAALAGNPDVIIINYPSNGYNVYSITESMLCLRIMKKAANDAGKSCYITTTQPRWGQGSFPDYSPSFNTPAIKRKMVALRDSILNEFGSFTLNFWDGLVNPADTTILAQYDSGDSTHFNAAGHRVLADRVIAKNIFTGSTLPVSFTGFSAYISGQQTNIQWTADGEEDISSYNVERSNDGTTFTVIRQVAARRQSAKNNYSVTDPSAAASSFYRVVAIGLSGQPTYTRVVKVVSNGASFELQKIVVGGLSVKAELHAAEAQAVTVQVVNSTGQIVSKLTATLQAGFNTLSIPASLPGNGMYFLRIFNSKQQLQVKSFLKD